MIRANSVRLQTGGLRGRAWASLRGPEELSKRIVVPCSRPLVLKEIGSVMLPLPPVDMWSLTAPLRICAYFHSAAEANRRRESRERESERGGREVWWKRTVVGGGGEVTKAHK